ncbi:MAG TPA: prolyl oligopeptidase family serine peptidase [Pyrinomonadaceae bacterium]|jgi:dipeptidyl aminopeptidase/acylaminoacyl peptidase|nr:prolyl oligopeptidase family serine peptidase [Pyrinomonadaceae bacterium]
MTPARRFSLLIATLFLLLSPVAAQKPVKEYTIEQFMHTTRLGGSSFSPDEKMILFHSNQTGIFNVYTIPTSGLALAELTNSTKESTYSLSYFPSDYRFLYTYDRGGNENSHIYLRELNGSERDLTPGEKTKANFAGWSRDRKSFYLTTNERDARFFDLYEMPIDTFKATLIYKDETGLEFSDISYDKKFIAFQKNGGSTADSDVFLYNVATKEMKNITEHKGDVANNPQAFDVASKYLYYLTDAGSEYACVARYDLATGKSETVEKAPWDISYTYFSRNGKYRVTAINEDARTKIKIYDQATGKTIDLPQLPDGVITGVTISPSEKLMAFYVNGDRSPNTLFVYNFETKQTMRVLDSLNPEINADDLVESQVIRYKSFDGMEIPSILYKPKNASAQQKAPALLLIHGGPGGQTRVGYNPLTQYLVNHGYVILGVNNRGSSGYGKTFFTADDGKHGREPLWDCVEAKKYLATLGYVDEKKIGIMGGSYGGYMVLAALAFKPEQFAVGVDLFGVSNWVRTLSSIPPYWESFRKSLYKEIGNPETDLENLRAVSPLFHADKIVKPLIVLQGSNDPRVIKPESDEIVENIKKRNGVVEYVLFDNEGHGFTKKANEIRAYKAILDFCDRYLKNGGQVSKG